MAKFVVFTVSIFVVLGQVPSIAFCQTSSKQIPSKLIRVTDATFLQEYHPNDTFHYEPISFTISRDGRLIAVFYADNVLRIWSATDGKLVSSLKTNINNNMMRVFGCDFASNNRWYALGGPWMKVRTGSRSHWEGGTISLFERESGAEFFRFVSHDIIDTFSISKERKHLTYITDKGEIGSIDLTDDSHLSLRPTMSLKPTGDLADQVSVNALLGHTAGISDDGMRATLLAANNKKETELLLYDFVRNSVQRIPTKELLKPTGQGFEDNKPWHVKKITLAPNGQLIAVQFNKIKHATFLYNCDNFQFIQKLLMKETEEIMQMQFDANNEHLALRMNSERINIARLNDSTIAGYVRGSGANPVQSMRFVGDQLIVLSNAGDRIDPLTEKQSEKHGGSRLFLWKIDAK